MSQILNKNTRVIDFDKFLRTNGFKIPDKDKIGKYDTTLLVSSNKDLPITVGRIHIPSYESPFDTITIIYYISRRQIEEALDFRDFLEKNNLPYEEEPSREEITKFLREQAKGTISLSLRGLADRIEGKTK